MGTWAVLLPWLLVECVVVSKKHFALSLALARIDLCESRVTAEAARQNRAGIYAHHTLSKWREGTIHINLVIQTGGLLGEDHEFWKDTTGSEER